MKKAFIYALCFLLVANPLLAAVFYVNPYTSNTGYDGSFDNEWKTLAQIEAYRTGTGFNDGDDIYFKAGTTITATSGDQLIIDWGGVSASNRATIGAYYGEGLFGLGGGDRPIIDGNDVNPTSGIIYGTLYDDSITGYVEIRDLKLINAHGYGIQLKGYWWEVSSSEARFIRGNRIYNVWVEDTGLAAAVLAQHTSYSIFDYITMVNCPATYGEGSTFDLQGSNNLSYPDVTAYNTITNCIINGSGSEGFNARQGASHNDFNGNIAWDIGNVAGYVDSGQSNIYRNNIFWQPATIRGGTGGAGIVIDNEMDGGAEGNAQPISDNVISGNYIANFNRGIALLNQSSTDTVFTKYYHTDTQVYDNRLVDNDTNFYFNHNNANWSGINIYNNYSFEFEAGYVHSNSYSPYGVTWDSAAGGVGNFFNSAVTGNANDADNPATSAYTLSQTWDWQALGDTATSVTASDFAFDESAPIISGLSPTSQQECGAVTMSLTTNENATCKYDTSATTYATMPYTFSTTGTTAHSQSVVPLCGQVTGYNIVCRDGDSNDSAMSTLNIDMAAAGGLTVSPMTIGRGGSVSITRGGSVSITR